MMGGGNPFDGDMDPRKMARMLRSTDRIGSLMQEKAPGWEATPAEIVADIVNVQRADVKRMADALDVEDPDTGEPIEIEMMSDDRAADLMAGITDGDALDVVLVFNELARKRDLVLKELLAESQHREFMRNKTSVMYTDDPDTWEDDEEDLPEPGGAEQEDVDEAVADLESEPDEEAGEDDDGE